MATTAQRQGVDQDRVHSILIAARNAVHRHPRMTAAVAWVLGFVAGLGLVAQQGGQPFYDAICYYVIDLDHLYAIAAVSMQAYGAWRYAPILAQLMDPLGALPLEVFLVGWTLLLLLVLAWMGGRRWWLLLGVPFVVLELYAGNIHLLIAAGIVAGFRRPGVWAFMALTKVTPFAGTLWFAFRREWRDLAFAWGCTVLVVALGVLIAPNLWREWLDSLVSSAGQPSLGLGGPLVVRLPLAMVLLAWAAPRDQRWALPVAVVLCLPNIWLHSLSILAASIALWPGFRRPIRSPQASADQGVRTKILPSAAE